MAQAVVGLGNAGARYQETRHNIGHRVVDQLADCLQAQRKLLTCFRPVPHLGQIAEGIYETDSLFLFKPASYMNESGKAVERFLRRLEPYSLAPANLILVYDDIDLPLGKVRVRLKGSHGGHRGVQSVIETLGTQALRRVKVGIGRPAQRGEVINHVLSRFTPDELPLIEAASTEAGEQVLKLLESALSRHTHRR